MIQYSVSQDAACAAVDGGAVVLNMRTKRYYSLNETGAAVWRLLEDELDVPTVVARLVELYDVHEVLAGSMVGALLDELVDESLISEVTK
jgi:hypothetical protein